jgi:hypothetical protein
MEIQVLKAQNPLTVPAIVYDRIWVELVEIIAPSPSGDANASVRLRRYAVQEDGSVVTEPDSSLLSIPNIISGSQTDPDLAAAFSAIMAYIAKAGIEQGIIAPPVAT